MARLVLTDPLFAIWRALIEERTGIHCGPGDRQLLESKVESRAMDAGFESLLDYYYFIRYDASSASELEALIDTVVVNETYFFREAEQLKALCDTMIAPLVARGERPRVWCAACSTGEEPLTLAMLLAERGLLSSVSIIASDIALRVLAKIKEGNYGPRSLRALPVGVAGKWLEISDGRARVAREIFDAVDWRRVNLTDAAAVAELGTFDAILCRNVLIYFSDETVKQVVATLSKSLRDSAPLLVGASESLLRFGTLLRCEEHAGSFFYMRTQDDRS